MRTDVEWYSQAESYLWGGTYPKEKLGFFKIFAVLSTLSNLDQCKQQREFSITEKDAKPLNTRLNEYVLSINTVYWVNVYVV